MMEQTLEARYFAEQTRSMLPLFRDVAGRRLPKRRGFVPVEEAREIRKG